MRYGCRVGYTEKNMCLFAINLLAWPHGFLCAGTHGLCGGCSMFSEYTWPTVFQGAPQFKRPRYSISSFKILNFEPFDSVPLLWDWRGWADFGPTQPPGSNTMWIPSGNNILQENHVELDAAQKGTEWDNRGCTRTENISRAWVLPIILN